jgi:hypothetical protein
MNSQSTVLILMPEEMRHRLESPLKRRFVEHGLRVRIGNYTPGVPINRDGFLAVLEFPWDLETDQDVDLRTYAKQRFRLKGFAWESYELPYDPAPSSHREAFRQLRQSTQDRESNKAFLNLLYNDYVKTTRQAALRTMKYRLQKYDGSLEKMQLERLYHVALDMVLEDAVQQVTGVQTLEGVMKSLMNVLVVDDLEERTVRGLVALGYRKKYIRTMFVDEMSAMYKEFKAEADKAEKPSNLLHFFQRHPRFRDFDIILLNQWRGDATQFSVKIGIRKQRMVSKKDEEYLAMLQRREAKKEELTAKRAEAQAKVERFASELQAAENRPVAELTDADERRYQRIVKNYKLAERGLKQIEQTLEKLDRRVEQKSGIVFQEFDVFASIAEHQGDESRKSMMAWAAMRRTDDAQQENRQKLGELCEMVRQRQKMIQEARRLELSIKKFSAELEQYARDNQLVSGKPPTYQRYVEDHIVEKLEMAALGPFLQQEYAFLADFRQRRGKGKRRKKKEEGEAPTSSEPATEIRN